MGADPGLRQIVPSQRPSHSPAYCSGVATRKLENTAWYWLPTASRDGSHRRHFDAPVKELVHGGCAAKCDLPQRKDDLAELLGGYVRRNEGVVSWVNLRPKRPNMDRSIAVVDLDSDLGPENAERGEERLCEPGNRRKTTPGPYGSAQSSSGCVLRSLASARSARCFNP
jgi:hypothetical protein